MRRTFLGLFILSGVLLGSCSQEQSTVKPEMLTQEEVTQIRQEIMKHMEGVVEGIETNDPEKLFRDFWRSDSATFFLNGVQMKGFDQIMNGFSQGMETRKNTNLELTAEEIVVLDRHAAMHLAEFTNAMQLANDTTVTVAGYWSAVFKKLDGQWKVVHVHESFNPSE
ncbi:YybH family protein [Robertkochia flava]|uniref:YybH family protein n=1 Tax=Robertkochia flava TaxID=3447986 RepID=UPI001CCC965A|nr:nuclear transport factor 2 family protein [Robertkochia marina]